MSALDEIVDLISKMKHGTATSSASEHRSIGAAA